jgi:hypothetical protein
VRSSLTPPCYPYTTSKGEGGKYPKQVSKGDLPVEVWTYCVIRVLYIDHIFIPSIWMLLIVTPQKLHQILVDYFCYAHLSVDGML